MALRLWWRLFQLCGIGLETAGPLIAVAHGERNAVHETVVFALGGKQAHIVGNSAQKRIQPFIVGLGEIAEDIVMHEFLRTRMADAKPHAAIILAAGEGLHMRVDGFDAVMTAGAAAGLDAQLARNEVEFVIDHDEIGRCQLVEAHGFADGLTRKVHKSLRLDQQHFFAVDHTVGNLGLKLLLPVGKAMAAEYFIRRHETDIVPVMRIFGARIAKTCNEQHGSEPLL